MTSDFGTIEDLAAMIEMNVRTLYRLRAKGVFRVAKRYGHRKVYYDLRRCIGAIERWAETGKISWR